MAAKSTENSIHRPFVHNNVKCSIAEWQGLHVCNNKAGHISIVAAVIRIVGAAAAAAVVVVVGVVIVVVVGGGGGRVGLIGFAKSGQSGRRKVCTDHSGVWQVPRKHKAQWRCSTAKIQHSVGGRGWEWGCGVGVQCLQCSMHVREHVFARKKPVHVFAVLGGIEFIPV